MSANRLRTHIDVCGLQRPFDGVDHLPIAERAAVAATIKADVEALAHIVQRCDLIATPIHYAEVARCVDLPRRRFMEALLQAAPIQVPLSVLTPHQTARLAAFQAAGIKEADAYHLMYAEENADLFVTVDLGLLTKAGSLATIPTFSLIDARPQFP